MKNRENTQSKLHSFSIRLFLFVQSQVHSFIAHCRQDYEEEGLAIQVMTKFYFVVFPL